MEDIELLEDLTKYAYSNHKKYYGFIYVTKNTISNKYYIGQKKFDNGSRWKSYLGSGIGLQKAIKKYGKGKFIRKITHLANTEDELNDLEYSIIKEFEAVKSSNFYNMIDGGSVIDALTRKNSEPVICIDTGYIFKSYSDASLWSGLSTDKIKGSFTKTHIFTDDYAPPIFRPLEKIKINHKLCSVCAKNYKPTTSNNVYCYVCQDSSYTLNRKSPIKNRKRKKSDLCYTIEDDWVFRYLIEYKIRNTKNKEKINKTSDNLINIRKHKDSIIEMYEDGESINQICKTLNIKNTADIKLFLVEWGINIKPTCYMNYSNPIVKEKYFRVTGKDILFFKYFFELKFWLEKYHTAKIGKSFIETKIKSREKINGYLIEGISEGDFYQSQHLYKKVDEL